MEEYLYPYHYDLVTPDGSITNLYRIDEKSAEADIFIQKISPVFVGFEIEKEKIFFNIKSTLAQVGVNGKGIEYALDRKRGVAQVKVRFQGIDPVGMEMLRLLKEGAFVGKLFAADERRRVRDPFYLSRMFGRADRWGRPLLSLGGLHGSEDLILDKVEGRAVAYLTLQRGRLNYAVSIQSFLPTLAEALIANYPVRQFLTLHQTWEPFAPCNVKKDDLLLVKTLPLHIRTVYGHVVNELLSPGYHHTTASVLQPDTLESGDVYELYGESTRELSDIPLEFYTLEPYREHVFFEDRDQLQSCLDNSDSLFEAFQTAPDSETSRSAVFVVKGEQLVHLKEQDWIKRSPRIHDFPGVAQGERQALMVSRYIDQQPATPFLKAIENGVITSQGVLLTNYFPSPMMKRLLLSNQVQRCLKGIYFEQPSQAFGQFFSSEDRALLQDLNKFAIPVYWVDQTTHNILQYVQKPDRDTGLFVPLSKVEMFLNATVFGIYGSNLLAGGFEEELRLLLQGLLDMRNECDHPFLNPKTPLALVTGGGPGAMEVGNRVAQELGILSCANIVDFTPSGDAVVMKEQRQNPYVEAKMTYRIDKLVERQAEFNLDFPILLIGGVGTDFEYFLEAVRRKVGAVAATPILLMGGKEYWTAKISSLFQCNLNAGTIAGSEWLSNCFYCIANAKQGLNVYRDYFRGTLPIGKDGPVFEKGFVVLE